MKAISSPAVPNRLKKLLRRQKLNHKKLEILIAILKKRNGMLEWDMPNKVNHTRAKSLKKKAPPFKRHKAKEPSTSLKWKDAPSGKKIIVALRKMRTLAIFLRPVVFPGYLEVIKKPMDLGTIYKKIEKDQYEETSEFVADVNLIWDNCCLFNPPRSAFHRVAVEARQISNNLLRENGMGAFVGKRKIEPAPASQDSGKKNSVPENSVIPASPVPTIPAPEVKELTRAEKEGLRSSILELASTEEIVHIIDIINKSRGGVQEADDEIVVDIESLSTQTCRTLIAFVEQRTKGWRATSRKFRREKLEQKLVSLENDSEEEEANFMDEDVKDKTDVVNKPAEVEHPKVPSPVRRMPSGLDLDKIHSRQSIIDSVENSSSENSDNELMVPHPPTIEPVYEAPVDTDLWAIADSDSAEQDETTVGRFVSEYVKKIAKSPIKERASTFLDDTPRQSMEEIKSATSMEDASLVEKNNVNGSVEEPKNLDIEKPVRMTPAASLDPCPQTGFYEAEDVMDDLDDFL